MHAVALSVPAGSVLVVRITGLDKAVIGRRRRRTGGARGRRITGGKSRSANAAPRLPSPTLLGREPPRPAFPTPNGAFIISGNGAARLAGPRGGLASSSALQAVPDRPPTISLAKEPQASGRTAMALSYKVEDVTNALSQYFYLEFWGLTASHISYLALAAVTAPPWRASRSPDRPPRRSGRSAP